MRIAIVFVTALLLPGYFQVASARQKPKGTLTASTPMSCKIEGKILRTASPDRSTTGPCSRYSCSALVRIISVQNCGQSVTEPLSEGDTATIKFEYTLHATAKLFPEMQVQYPGLKKGRTFVANAEQRLKMGGKPAYVVYGYTVR